MPSELYITARTVCALWCCAMLVGAFTRCCR